MLLGLCAALVVPAGADTFVDTGRLPVPNLRVVTSADCRQPVKLDYFRVADEPLTDQRTRKIVSPYSASIPEVPRPQKHFWLSVLSCGP